MSSSTSRPRCGVQPGGRAGPIAILLGFTVVSTVVAAKLFRWDD